MSNAKPATPRHSPDQNLRFAMLGMIPGNGFVQLPGLVAIAPGSGLIMMPPVSVCHHVSTIGQRSPPITR